jgi:hypothetical protein
MQPIAARLPHIHRTTATTGQRIGCPSPNRGLIGGGFVRGLRDPSKK